MVGEIRDTETMETAIEAALTGHLVLSTLHTNSAVATVTRLVEMGVEPYLLASALTGVLAQRLVRKTCETCREPMPAPPTLGPLFDGNPPDKVWKGVGCEECRGTGFRGRVGVFELLTLDDDVRRLMFEGASEADLTKAARAGGLVTIRDQALDCVRAGTTTLEEVVRISSDR